MVYEMDYSRWFYSGDHLEHFGIKGQKWGLRRFQNEDGTLTDEGMRRYGVAGDDGKYRVSDAVKRDYRYQKAKSTDINYKEQIAREKKENKPISKRRQQLIEDYKAKGLPQDQAEVQALKRENTEKILKIAGAVAVTAAVAYGAYKGHQWLMKNGDKKIKAGSEIFRTTKFANEDMNRAGYVVDNAKDADKYVGAYGAQINRQRALARVNSAFLRKEVRPEVADNNIYQITGKAAGNIKVAGDRKANKVYQQLLANDKEFAADNEVVRSRWADNPFAGVGKGNDYKDFNARLVDHQDAAASRVQKKFYEALKAKGYGGLIDSNDRDTSGYHVNKPVILFNMRDSIDNVGVRSINLSEVQDKYPKALGLMQKQAVKDVTVSSAMKTVRNWSAYGAVGSGVALASVKTNDRAVLKRGAQYKTIIRQYKKEHPGTKLSDSQILENELGHKPK